MTDEFEFSATDGLKLFGRKWVADDPKALVCIVHGLGEHSGRYQHVARRMNEAGLTVYAFDLRGHGKSEGKRGHADYEDLMNDITVFLNTCMREYPDIPLFLYGHSLGGNLVINYGLKRKSPVKGIISTAPFLKLTKEVPTVLVAFARFLNRVYPSLTLSNGLDPSDLSHDPQVVKAYQDDPLVHDRISARLFIQSYDAGRWALENAFSFSLPLLLMHGDEDKITSFEASREFAQKAGKVCTFKAWKGMYHEIHNEPEWKEVVQFTISWVRSHI
jgi:alpha-beta hydrolase superfamily lysophospholipase